jgi:hypothetical protein
MRRRAGLAWSLCFIALSLLAACGGGGGNPPPVPSTNPGPTAHPTATPTPTAKPTATPSPTPTPAPTATPTPTATATPTGAPSPTPTPNTKLVYSVGAGEINGDDTVFTGSPNAYEKNDGDYPSGGHGPLNSNVTGPDGVQVPCLSTMPGGGYHVHAFLGFYNNGSAVALSDGIGMAEPEDDGDYNVNNTTLHNWTNYATMCYYETHTHDASGVIHIETPSPTCGENTNNTVPCSGSEFTLGDFLAVWGVQITPVGVFSNGVPILNGAVQIYTSGQVSRGGPPPNSAEVGSNYYSLYTGDPNAIALYSHEVIFVDVGSGNLTGSSLPNVAFYEEW